MTRVCGTVLQSVDNAQAGGEKGKFLLADIVHAITFPCPRGQKGLQKYWKMTGKVSLEGS